MPQTRSATAGNKHELDESASQPPSKVQKKDDKDDFKGGEKKKQLTLDESLDGNKKDKNNAEKPDQNEPKPDENDEEGMKNKPRESEAQSSSKKEDNGDTAVEPHGRNGTTPSSILEKGIIYFFFRGRIGIDHPEKVSDVARSYMVLRPIPKDAKLGDGPIGDGGNSRLIAIPKKVLPQSGEDRWIAIVEKTNASFARLKDEFLAANDYETKTAGTRHSPAATPIGEGVYAITTTGRESHLVYMLTLPENPGEVQTEIGLKDKGSWIVSTRNPQYPAPKNTALPEGPDFSKEVLDEFRSLRWMGTLPRHLVPNAQFLLVGEPSGVDRALQADERDGKARDEVEEPIVEMEKLGEEDAERMEHLGKDSSEAIFKDLEASAQGYPKLQTTF